MLAPLRNFSAPVAQLDRVLPSEGRGRTFESSRARQRTLKLGTSSEVPFLLPESPTSVRCLWRISSILRSADSGVRVDQDGW